MANTKTSRQRRQLIILADGGALSDLNDRIRTEWIPLKSDVGLDESFEEGRVGNSARFGRPIDFRTIPDQIRAELMQRTGFELECPPSSRVFCNVGSEKARNFLESMATVWTVRTFPMSTVRYDRASKDDKYPFRLRFHAYIGFALGLLAGNRRNKPRTDASPNVEVAIVSDDPHLLPCISDGSAKEAGISARLVWWDNYLDQQVSEMATRYRVPVTLLSTNEGHRELADRDNALAGLLSV